MHEQSEMKIETSAESKPFRTAKELLGRQRWCSQDSSFAVHEPTDGHGYMLYRGRLLTEIPEMPILLVIRKQYAIIEKLIQDHSGSPESREKLLRACYDIFARHGVQSSQEGQCVIVELACSCWQQGHPLLKMIAEKCNRLRETSWTPESTKAVFGDAYFAKCIAFSPLLEFKYARLEREWQEQGRRSLPRYFERFGVMTAESHYRQKQAQATQEAESIKGRPPASQEMIGINVLIEATRLLDPDLLHILERRHVTYRIARSRFIMGTLRAKEMLRRPRVYLSERIFSFEFPTALAVFVHEHAHVLGCDGGREFTDALTWLLDAVIRHCDALKDFDRRWLNARLEAFSRHKEMEECVD